MLPQYQL
ncbi:hypothetical protein LINPERHAP1_LOCUS15439 [Linum perenne]